MTRLSSEVKNQVLDKIRAKYKAAGKKDKSAIISHIMDLTGYHRKYAIQKLSNEQPPIQKTKRIRSAKYDAALRDQLIKIWHASDRIGSKRLAQLLPQIIPALEKGERIKLTDQQRSLLAEISAATIERLLKGARKEAKGKV